MPEAPVASSLEPMPRGLYAHESARDLGARRCIKLRLPLRQHIQLHALRLHSGESASAMVEAALETYFERRRREAGGRVGPGRAPEL